MSAPRPAPGIVRGYIVPGLPHPLLVPERSPAWQLLRGSFERVRREIESTPADVLLLYSTQWISIIGHQIQAEIAVLEREIMGMLRANHIRSSIVPSGP